MALSKRPKIYVSSDEDDQFEEFFMAYPRTNSTIRRRIVASGPDGPFPRFADLTTRLNSKTKKIAPDELMCDRRISAINLSDDEILCGFEDGRIRRYAKATLKFVQTYTIFYTPVTGIYTSRNDSFLATAGKTLAQIFYDTKRIEVIIDSGSSILGYFSFGSRSFIVNRRGWLDAVHFDHTGVMFFEKMVLAMHEKIDSVLCIKSHVSHTDDDLGFLLFANLGNFIAVIRVHITHGVWDSDLVEKTKLPEYYDTPMITMVNTRYWLLVTAYNSECISEEKESRLLAYRLADFVKGIYSNTKILIPSSPITSLKSTVDNVIIVTKFNYIVVLDGETLVKRFIIIYDDVPLYPILIDYYLISGSKFGSIRTTKMPEKDSASICEDCVPSFRSRSATRESDPWPKEICSHYFGSIDLLSNKNLNLL